MQTTQWGPGGRKTSTVDMDDHREFLGSMYGTASGVSDLVGLQNMSFRGSSSVWQIGDRNQPSGKHVVKVGRTNEIFHEFAMAKRARSYHNSIAPEVWGYYCDEQLGLSGFRMEYFCHGELTKPTQTGSAKSEIEQRPPSESGVCTLRSLLSHSLVDEGPRNETECVHQVLDHILQFLDTIPSTDTKPVPLISRRRSSSRLTYDLHERLERYVYGNTQNEDKERGAIETSLGLREHLAGLQWFHAACEDLRSFFSNERIQSYFKENHWYFLTFVHGDLHLSNIVMHDFTGKVVDFAKSGEGLAFRDHCTLEWGTFVDPIYHWAKQSSTADLGTFQHSICNGGTLVAWLRAFSVFDSGAPSVDDISADCPFKDALYVASYTAFKVRESALKLRDRMKNDIAATIQWHAGMLFEALKALPLLSELMSSRLQTVLKAMCDFVSVLIAAHAERLMSLTECAVESRSEPTSPLALTCPRHMLPREEHSDKTIAMECCYSKWIAQRIMPCATAAPVILEGLRENTRSVDWEGSYRSFDDLMKECIDGDCVMFADGEGNAMRFVNVAVVFIAWSGHSHFDNGVADCDLVLMEKEQSVRGKKRKRFIPLCEKMKTGESCTEAAKRGISEELKVDKASIMVDMCRPHMSFISRKSSSDSYKGLKTVYLFHIVHAHTWDLPVAKDEKDVQQLEIRENEETAATWTFVPRDLLMEHWKFAVLYDGDGTRISHGPQSCRFCQEKAQDDIKNYV